MGQLRLMNIEHGFLLESPEVAVPWGISETELAALIKTGLRKITVGYLTLPCTSLPGLPHNLGFHFEPRSGGRLVELEFFRSSYPNLAASFREFQEAFEKEFGPPSKTAQGDHGLPSYEWIMGTVSIRHFILERFGPEEHMRIRWRVP
jgi:hypothetical protein